MRVESKGWGKRGSRVRGFTTGSTPRVAMKLWLAALDVFGDDHACLALELDGITHLIMRIEDKPHT